MTDPECAITYEVLGEIADERVRQMEKWGRQDLPMLPTLSYRYGYGEHMRRHKSLNDRRATLGQLTWDSILLEEVYEALEELDPLKQEVELVQVAAVATAAVECLRLRRLATECDCPDPDAMAA